MLKWTRYCDIYHVCTQMHLWLNPLARRDSLNVNQIQQQKSLLESQARYEQSCCCHFGRNASLGFQKSQQQQGEHHTGGGPKSNKNKAKGQPPNEHIYTGTPQKKSLEQPMIHLTLVAKVIVNISTCLPCGAWFAQMTIYWENSACLGLVRSNEMSS